MKTGVKLTLGFSIIVIVMQVALLFCLNANEKALEEFEALEDNTVPSVITANNMEVKCQQTAHDIISYMVTADEEELAAVKACLKSLQDAATEHLKYKKHTRLQEQESAKQLMAEIERFASVCTEIINLKKQGVSVNELLKKNEDSLHPMTDKLLVHLKKIKAKHMRELAEAKGAVFHAHILGDRVALLVSVTVVFLSAMIALITTRSIVRPIKALHKGTEIIGKGNLDYKVATKAKDEIGQLSRAFDKMTQNLKTTTTSIDKLDAANQHLRANEQQLRTVNQQLESEIAERKKTEEALEISNRELEDFVYIASHDLREPLRKISSFGELLQKSLQGKLSEDDQENMDFMIDGAERMTAMIDGLLTYSRVNTKELPFETVDLNEIIEQLKELELGMLLEETGGIIEVPQPLPKVDADPVQIKQLLQNLIANGIKFRSEGIKPRITIKAEETSDNTVKIEVQDNGIGIAPEYCDGIFTMFKRLHSRRQYDGCGIGLSVCRRIVDRHAGRIGVESEPGAGSTFWFTLSPARDATPASEVVIVS